MPAGGYQAPAQPAAASGPGALSKRTDGGAAQKLRNLPDAQYGENQEFVNLQRQAPLAQDPHHAPPSASAGAPAGPDLASMAVPLTAPTQRPDEPITHGVNVGPGAGSEVLNLPSPVSGAQTSAAQLLQQMAQRSGSPAAQYLAQLAQRGTY